MRGRIAARPDLCSALVRIRDAHPVLDRPTIERLWLEYLTWGGEQLEARYGLRFPPAREAVDHDLAHLATFTPPDGRTLLAVDGDGDVIGIGCLRRIAPGVGEIKRMYVRPSHRGVGAGRAILEGLIHAACEAGYEVARLDSPDFLDAAHALYRSAGFAEIAPYPETEIPEAFRGHWLFMELRLDEPAR
jgi:GNAT superfamily N-acetyltransferase